SLSQEGRSSKVSIVRYGLVGKEMTGRYFPELSGRRASKLLRQRSLKSASVPPPCEPSEQLGAWGSAPLRRTTSSTWRPDEAGSSGSVRRSSAGRLRLPRGFRWR